MKKKKEGFQRNTLKEFIDLCGCFECVTPQQVDNVDRGLKQVKLHIEKLAGIWKVKKKKQLFSQYF